MRLGSVDRRFKEAMKYVFSLTPVFPHPSGFLNIARDIFFPFFTGPELGPDPLDMLSGCTYFGFLSPAPEHGIGWAGEAGEGDDFCACWNDRRAQVAEWP